MEIQGTNMGLHGSPGDRLQPHGTAEHRRRLQGTARERTELHGTVLGLRATAPGTAGYQKGLRETARERNGTQRDRMPRMEKWNIAGYRMDCKELWNPARDRVAVQGTGRVIPAYCRVRAGLHGTAGDWTARSGAAGDRVDKIKPQGTSRHCRVLQGAGCFRGLQGTGFGRK